MLKCIRCGREITRTASASVIPAASGVHAWGPKCARIAGLVQSRPARVRVERQGQGDLFEESDDGKAENLR